MIKNMKQLRVEMSRVIDKVDKDKSYIPQAVAISNAAGKLIGTVRCELEYHKLRRERPPYNAFVCGSGK